MINHLYALFMIMGKMINNNNLLSRGWRLPAGVICPGGMRAKLSILIYHRVLKTIDPMMPDEVDAKAFSWQMDLIARNFNVLPLHEAVRLLYSGVLPPRALCITFDDGYADNAEIALPILRKYNLTATFFVATGFLDGGRMWNDTVIEAIRRIPGDSLDLDSIGLGSHSIASWVERKKAISNILSSIKHKSQEDREMLANQIASYSPEALPKDLMMGSSQVRELSRAGMEIGGHTVSHPILSRLTLDEARSEIVRGREFLESLIGQQVQSFAYPNGKIGQDYGPEHVEMIASLGFEAAVSTASGVSTQNTDRWQLKRFTPWDRTRMKFMLRLLKNYF